MIDTEAPRFKVLTVTGYPITASSSTPGNARPGLSATVYDTFYLRDIATFRSSDTYPASLARLMGAARSYQCECGGPKAPQAHRCRQCAKRSGAYRPRAYGFAGALLAAAARCAELNAWHEREGWGEDVSLAGSAL